MLALLHLVQEHPLNQSDVSTSWSDVSDDSDHYPKGVIRSELLTAYGLAILRQLSWLL